MTPQTMSRILLTTLIVALAGLAYLLLGEGMRWLGWLSILGGIVLLVLVWVPWPKLTGKQSTPAPAAKKPEHHSNKK
jgi:hypothetical protein